MRAASFPIGRLVPVSALFLAVAALGFSGCQKQEAPPEEAAPAGERVENAEAGVAIVALPAMFELESNDGGEIVLVPAPAEPPVEGRLVIRAGEPETGGINLVAAVEEHQAEIEGRAEGTWAGQRELGTHIGTAFYSRGRYPGEDGREMEETAVYLVHPWGDRTLDLVYVYPAGEDTKVRIEDHLFTVLGELEPLPAPGG